MSACDEEGIGWMGSERWVGSGRWRNGSSGRCFRTTRCRRPKNKKMFDQASRTTVQITSCYTLSIRCTSHTTKARNPLVDLILLNILLEAPRLIAAPLRVKQPHRLLNGEKTGLFQLPTDIRATFLCKAELPGCTSQYTYAGGFAVSLR